MAARELVEFILLRNEFPRLAGELGPLGQALEDDAAAFWAKAAQDQLWPGHGYDTGFMHDHIVARGNEVKSEAKYSGYVNDGTSRMAGIGFWDTAEALTREWLEEEGQKALGRWAGG